MRLVESLLEATGFEWVRFLYAYPTTLDEALLAALEHVSLWISM